MQTIAFEKDNDDNFHMDVVAGLANMRARNYRIPEVDKLRAKLIAGNIIPAIATATALATGGYAIIYHIRQRAMQTLASMLCSVTISVLVHMFVNAQARIYSGNGQLKALMPGIAAVWIPHLKTRTCTLGGQEV